jgi:hypothetical protein
MEGTEAEVWRGQVRLPMVMAHWVKEQARDNFRSMNAEFVEILRIAMREETSAQK